ncbi:MAG: hypothetical protein ACLFTV_02675 [Desulfococcaceae bacterium]
MSNEKGILLGNQVLSSVTPAMAADRFLEARFGAGLAVRRGAHFNRPIFLAAVSVNLVRPEYVNFR